ncbi:MAG TPA: aminomethyl-transferring glycine dehydrogenase subunit GcvPA [Erysipelotrichaceae bacterium]|nr:aminomethyl-transferring glycine dehydrogenase subunit GcvPA [Erysipelotrichaceae bacterium]
MASYVVNTKEQREKMLAEAGIDEQSFYASIPQDVKLQRPLNLPKGKSELEVLRHMKHLASLNTVYDVVLRGAGSESHFIPAVVRQLSAREEFVTAYTPYQAELSQGILQSIFEYQSSICAITGMDACNASVYDGASAVAEAVNMTGDRKRTVALLPKSIHPETLETVKTYTQWLPITVKEVEIKDGKVDVESLKSLLTNETACIVLQQPNYFGILEDVEGLAKLAHEAGAKVIVSANPMTLGVLKTPREQGADIAVGEAQPLGLPMSFGGPYLGYMATTTDMVRRLPGRIVGQTLDLDGKRAFVLTLQAREQHIRREKASSSICSNQAHCALTAGMYLAAMGPQGLKDVATHCTSKAHYLFNQLATLGFTLRYDSSFFHEFVTDGPLPSIKVEEVLSNHGILSGLPLDETGILWCVTETSTKNDLDRVVSILKEVLA